VAIVADLGVDAGARGADVADVAAAATNVDSGACDVVVNVDPMPN